MASVLPHEGRHVAQQMLPSVLVLPEELIVQILSWVPVKALMRYRCVSKTWNSLIFDPILVKLHLRRSSKNTHVLLTFDRDMNPEEDLADESIVCASAAPCSICHLLENPSSTIDDCFRRFNHNNFVFGTCNELVCLHDSFFGEEFEEYWFRFWNPATRIMSEDSPRLRLHSCNYEIGPYSVNCGFGFDDCRDTYKVVVILLDIKSQEREVRVHCLGDTCWRKILTCPAFTIVGEDNGQFASGTINWSAVRRLSSDIQWKTVTIDELVIFSYDLKNETYRYLLMLNGLFEVPPDEPYLGVLKGCLCLSHDHRRTHFIVWLLRHFGIEKSWTQLLNVSYDDLQIRRPCPVMPLCISENEDVLFVADYGRAEFVVYNRRDNTIDHTEGFKDYTFSFYSYDYVQSLVLPYLN